MSKIIVIGAGFAGLSALRRLKCLARGSSILLIDKSKESNFLPMLPDCLGRGIRPDCLAYRIDALSKRWKFGFVNEKAVSVDLSGKKVFTGSGSYDYDYLLIASGSETNFYGNANIKEGAFALDDTNDAKKIINALKEHDYDTLVIGGGGYTGIEVATNLRLYFQKINRGPSIIIVERAPAILGPLPDWMKEYVNDNLKRLNIHSAVNSTIEKIDGKRVSVSGGILFDNAAVIWAAGVKTAGFIQDIKAEKNPQGRLKVDEYLCLNENCFVAGDAAYFSHRNSFLRMAVQFSIAQGDLAARNLIAKIKGGRLSKYHPLDLGYIIPMANNRSCGEIFGLRAKGTAATMLHFIMCIYRSYGLKNKSGILKDLITGGRGKSGG